MNKTVSEATAFVRELAHQVTDLGGIQVGLTPPFTALEAVRNELGPAPPTCSARKISIGKTRELLPVKYPAPC
jgi:hypothetical protein